MHHSMHAIIWIFGSVLFTKHVRGSVYDYAGFDLSTGFQSNKLSPSRVGAVAAGLDGVKNYRFYGWPEDVQIAQSIVDASSFKDKLRFYIEIIPSKVNDLSSSDIKSLLDTWSSLKQYVYWIALGNEPAHEPQASYINFNGMPSKLRMFYDYLKAQSGWEHTKVSIPFSAAIVGKSYPVQHSEFKSEYRNTLTEIIQILDANNGPFSVQWYPFFTCLSMDELLDYCLGNEARDEYSSMLEAQVDATHYALQRLVPNNNVEIMVTETGWPTAGNHIALVANARSYYENTLALMANPSSKLYQKYIFFFELFDEDKKYGADTEKHFGVYDKNGYMKLSGLDDLTGVVESYVFCPPLNTDSRNGGRCGPKYGGKRCNRNLRGYAEYCNTSNGWCGTTNNHRYAQRGDIYDFFPESCIRPENKMCPPLNTNSRNGGRCGPSFGGKRCNKNLRGYAEYCNTSNGWCGTTSAHKNAQGGDRYDFNPVSCIKPE